MSRTSVSRLASAFAMAGVLAACADSPTTSSPAASSDLAPQDVPAFSAGVSAAVIPGRFIVTLRDGADARGVAREHGVAPDFVYTAALNGFAGSISDAARAGLLRDARVQRVEQDGIATTQTTQNGATWGLDRTDQRARPTNGTYIYNNTGNGVTA
jgi:aqualysin 1